MKRCFLPFFFIVVSTATGQVDFNRYFIDRTMRVDYFHTGTKDSEVFALDRVYKEGPWPGSLVNLIDTLNLGEYFLRVYDASTHALIYSRGYCTVFNEWQTTDEALKGIRKTISETVRFPFPKRPVQMTISRRDKFSHFHEIYSVVIDPNDPVQICTEIRHKSPDIINLMDNGDIHRKADILILGDGYTAGEIEKFRRDAEHFNNVMFSTSPFRERRKDFNVRAVWYPSIESGIDRPDVNVWKNTPIGCSYNTFGSERYVLTEANQALRDIASAVPYDFICILINDDRYGGGGIYHLYTTTYTIEKNPNQAWRRDYVYVHEFGHAFGGLADEYYSSSTGYNEFYPEGVEPWEPNITRLFDPTHVKWQNLLTPAIDIPTPWNKENYDSLTARLSRFRVKTSTGTVNIDSMRTVQQSILRNPALLGKVGAFEGAGYLSNGMYRPSLDCRMFTLSLTDFCAVCRSAIERQIDFYAN
ncbi:MAG: M64 family metallopeptidase [Bacteroidota bacterium]|nr:M64 family metallopeptidase [Bacteroidota bacterium]